MPKKWLTRMAAAVAPMGMALGLAIATAGPAGAFVIDNTTNVGDTFTISFQLLVGQTDNGGNRLTLGTESLTGEIKYTVDLIDLDLTGRIDLTIDVTNTSNIDPAFPNGDNIMGFGFFTSPEVSINGFTGGTTFASAAEDTNFPSFQNIDICIFAQNCAGGAFHKGLAPGNTDQVMLSLVGDLSAGSLGINPSVVKFQGDRGSFEFRDLPEPSSLALFGIGLLGLGFLMRRRGFFAG